MFQYFFFLLNLRARTGGREESTPRRSRSSPTNESTEPEKLKSERFLFHPENHASNRTCNGINALNNPAPNRVNRFRTCHGQRRAMLPAPNHETPHGSKPGYEPNLPLADPSSSRERRHYETTGRAAILGRMLAIQKAHD